MGLVNVSNVVSGQVVDLTCLNSHNTHAVPVVVSSKASEKLHKLRFIPCSKEKCPA